MMSPNLNVLIVEVQAIKKVENGEKSSNSSDFHRNEILS